MKKIISVLIAAALLMSLMVSAFAADAEVPTLTVDTVTAEAGETVTLNVTMSATTYAAYGLQIVYDETALELVSIDEGDEALKFFTANTTTGKVTDFSNKDTDVEGVIFSMTFNVLETAAAGTHEVSLEIDSFNKADQSEIEVTAVAGGVVIEGEPEPEPTPVPTLTVGSATAQVGDTVTLDVTMSAATYAAYGLQIVYDATALELVSIDEGDEALKFFTANTTTGKVTDFSNKDTDVEGVIFTMTFNVLAAGEHTVSLEIDSFNKADQSEIEVNPVAGIVSVESEPVEPGVIYEGSMIVETTDTYCYVDLYTLVAPVTGSYTFFVPAGLGVSDPNAGWFDPPIVDFYNNVEGATFTRDLVEGEEFEFYVGATTKGEWTITYTVVESEGGEEPTPVLPPISDLVMGNNAINAADVGFRFTATEAGTLILNLGNAIMGPVEGVVTVNGENEQNLYSLATMELALEAGDEVLIIFTASGYATLTAEWTTGSQGGEVEGTDLTIGNNSINAEDVTYVYTATEAGVLKLTMGGAIMGAVDVTYSVNGGEAIVLALNSSVELALEAGDQVVIVVTAAGYATLTADWTTDGGEEPGPGPGPDVPGPSEPDGTQNNPFIIETLPYEGTHESTDDDLYYQWTATEDGFLYVYTDGSCVLSGSSVGSWEYTDGGKYIQVAAGDVIVVNVWAATSFTVEFVAAGDIEIDYIILESVENVTIDLTAGASVYYKWIATKDGEITFSVTNYTWSASYLFQAYINDQWFNSGEIVLNVTAGEEVIFYFEVYGYSGDGSLTINGVYASTECEHVFVETERQNATCTEDGYVTYTCECGESYTEEIPATGHTYEVSDSKEATCVEAGYVTYTCACGHTYTEEIPATGEHVFEDGVCTVCGAEDSNPDTSSLNVMAIALIAAMSVTAVVVTASKKEEQE